MEQIRTFYGDEADDVLRKLEGIFISHDHTDHHLVSKPTSYCDAPKCRP